MTQAAVDIARPVVTPVAQAAGQAALVAGTAAYKVADPALRSTIRAIVQIVLEEVDLNAIIANGWTWTGSIASVDLDAALSLSLSGVQGRYRTAGIVATVEPRRRHRSGRHRAGCPGSTSTASWRRSISTPSSIGSTSRG